MGNARAKYEIVAEDKTKAALRSVKKGFGGIGSAMKALGPIAQGVLAATAAGAAAAAAVVAFAKSAATDLDNLAKSANRLGIAVDQLDALNFAAELAGASGKDLETIYKRGARSIVDAADGIGEGAKALDRLGISARNTDGTVKGVEQVLLEFADALPRLASETEVTATAMQLFGRSGQTLIPMLRQGSDAIRKQLVEARALGVRTADLTAKGEDFVDAQLRLNRAFRTTKDVVAGALLPSLSQLADTIANKLAGLVTGLSREYREFLGALALEAPNTQLQVLHEELARTESEIPALTKRLDELRESVRGGMMQAADGTETWRDTIPGVTDRIAELTAQQQALNDQIQIATERREQGLAYEERIRAAREFEQQQLKTTLDAEGERLLHLATREQLERDIAASLAAQLRFSRDIPDEPPAFDLTQLPPPREVSDAMVTLATAADNAADTMSSRFGAAFVQVASGALSTADAFRQLWMSAIADVAEELASGLFREALKAIIPGGSFLGALFTKAGDDGGGGDLAGRAVTYNFQSVIPPTTDQLAAAELIIQESAIQNARFGVGSRG